MAVVGWVILWTYALFLIVSVLAMAFMVGHPRPPVTEKNVYVAILFVSIFLYGLLMVSFGG